MKHLGKQVLAKSSSSVICSNVPEQPGKTRQNCAGSAAAAAVMFRTNWSLKRLLYPALLKPFHFSPSNYSLKLYCWYFCLECTAAEQAAGVSAWVGGGIVLEGHSICSSPSGASPFSFGVCQAEFRIFTQIRATSPALQQAPWTPERQINAFDTLCWKGFGDSEEHSSPPLMDIMGALTPSGVLTWNLFELRNKLIYRFIYTQE